MKKTIAMLMSALVTLGCAGALVACGDGKTDKPADDNPPKEEIQYSVYGRFTYEKDGKTKDDKGATYECWVDTGNKFHIYGTLAHDDGTTSTLEFEGQVINITQYTIACAQVMFFKYTYHGVEYPAGFNGPVAAVTKAYKNAWAEEYGDSNYDIMLVRKTNDTSAAKFEDTKVCGTFYAEDGWDLAEGVWEFDPTATAN